MFGERSVADPWILKLQRCFLCGIEMRQEVIVEVHPPTAGIGILCIDGGGTRGIVPLKLMKRIEDRIEALVGLRTPLQKFCKLAFGISSGESWSTRHKPSTNFLRWFDRPRALYQRLVRRKVYGKV